VLEILEHIITRGGLIGLRVGGLMTFAPFFSSSSFPTRIKAVMTLALTALLYPTLTVPVTAMSPERWTQVALRESVLGLATGLCLQFVFEGVLLAGQIGGFQLGFSLVNVIDPQTNVDTPVLSTFVQMSWILLGLELNLHHWILRGVCKSFLYVPVGGALFGQGVVRELLRDAGAMFLVGVQIAAPLLFATVVIDVTVGFLSKASPQLPAILLSIPMKNLVGYAVLAIGIGLWPGLFERQFLLALGWSERLLHLAAP
jgi:flagellar biosynthesis protein FliR